MNKNSLTLAKFSQMTGIPVWSLIGPERNKHLSVARQVHWLLLRSQGTSNSNIAQMYRRRRASIISGLKTIRNLVETNDTLILPYLDLIESFTHQEKSV